MVMSPANFGHTELQVWMLRLLAGYVEEHDLGIVLHNMLVRIRKCRRFRIPDIFFVARERIGIIGDTMLREPPDMVVEIVSPDSAARDWREKYEEYEEFGIREYWVIDPDAQSFDVYALNRKGKYQRIAIEDGVIRSQVIAGFWMRAEWFAAPTRPTVKAALRRINARK
jgi:Uma2 family endonuclease